MISRPKVTKPDPELVKAQQRELKSTADQLASRKRRRLAARTGRRSLIATSDRGLPDTLG